MEPCFDPPSRNHSELTESSMSSAPSSYTSPPPPRIIVALSEGDVPEYTVCEEPSPTTITGKQDRRFSKLLTWRFVLSPLHSFLKKKTNSIRPRQNSNESRLLPVLISDKALPSPQHSNSPDGSRPKSLPRTRHSLFRSLGRPQLHNKTNANRNIASAHEHNTNTNRQFNRHLFSSPIPQDLDVETAETKTDSVNKENGLVARMRPDGDNSSQAASHSPSAVSIGGNGLPQTNSNLPGQCVTPELALLHATSKEEELRDVLAESCWEGSYLIQVGFNQDMLHSNQGLLQEIYLFLESEVHPTQAEKIAGTLDPFPIIIYTPDTTHHYPPSEGGEDLWDLWTLRGIFCSEITEQKTADNLAPSDAGDNSTKPAGTTGPSSASGGIGGHSGDSSTHRDGHGRAGDDSNGSDGRDNGGGDKEDEDAGNHACPQIEIHADRGYSTREISIPFSSTLTMSGEKKQPPTRYKTNACVDIKLEDNIQSQSRPPGQSWGGPWFEAKFTLLDAEMHATPRGKLGYHLGLSQIRIMASGCPTSILAYYPTILRADSDDVKSGTEKNNAIGVRVTLGASPSARIDGASSQTSSEERSQNRWEVTAHCLPLDRDNTGEPRKTVMWKYSHNDKFYTPETRNVFEPKPSAIFGYSRTSFTLPKLEIEVVMDYSWSAPAQTFRDWIADTARSKPKYPLPAFSNFLHQVSVTVELERVKESAEWVVGLDAEDQYKASEIGKEAEPILGQLESNTGASACDVLLKRALHGHIYLTEEQRKEHKTDPRPWPLQTSSRNRDAEDFLGVGGLLTPSPSPTSSVMNGECPAP